MSRAAVDALRAEHQRALELFESLTPDEWQAASGCAGWRVHDVAQHMASTFHVIADPSTIDGGSSDDAESNAEVPVQARMDWTADQVLAEYREWADKGIAALAGMQEAPLAEMVIPLGNLGSHPMHVLANAIVFDHYCHLRHDIGAAVARAAALPRDGAALTATLEWMLMGLPQMCASALSAAPRQAVNFQFDGVPDSEFVLAPALEPDGVWTVVPGRVEGAPTCRTTAHDFVSWGTKRADWRASSQLDGEADATEQAAGVLDAINII